MAAVVCAGAAWADRPAIELSFYADYVWTSQVSAAIPDGSGGSTPGNLDIKDNPAFGLALDIEVRPGTQVELFYQRQDSETEFRPSTVGAPTETGFEVATSYYHIGALQGYRRGKWMPFTGLTLGATSFDPQGTEQSTEWNFSFGFHAGTKVYLTERIGLRMHGRLFSTLIDGGAGLWYGTGGLSVTVGGSALWQWGLGGGIVISL